MLNVSEIVKTIKELIEVRFQIVRDGIKEKISAILTRIFLLILMATVGFLVMIFASISLAFYLSELTYSTYKGFLYVGLIYLLILMFLLLIRSSKRLLVRIQDFFTTLIFK
jgi:ABC-type phosphate/phosphonate transport system permease subunit